MNYTEHVKTIQAILRERVSDLVEIDGDIGRITTEAVRSIGDEDTAKAVQVVLKKTTPDLAVDGIVGFRTMGALERLDRLQEGDEHRWTEVLASSFADPADVKAFWKCKDSGKTDMQCFAVGDNGIGKWGHRTAQDSHPMAALPREVWARAGKKGGDSLLVECNGKTVLGILGDTMPSLANIKNGCGIDLNPAFAKELGLKPPFKTKVQWRWA